MSCCGRGRAAVAGIGPSAAAGGTGRRAGLGVTGLRYTGSRPARVRGSATGRTYDVRGAGDEVAVDTRDVPALLRTRLFSRV
ncbi:MAG TPA: hypothetical protein VGJ44_04095 [Kribbellaceae bacterium]|jgi:hypothetical protein